MFVYRGEVSYGGEGQRKSGLIFVCLQRRGQLRRRGSEDKWIEFSFGYKGEGQLQRRGSNDKWIEFLVRYRVKGQLQVRGSDEKWIDFYLVTKEGVSYKGEGQTTSGSNC